MTEAEEVVEPDTPAEEVAVTFPGIVADAQALALFRVKINHLEREYNDQRKRLLVSWEQMPNLHGIRLANGDAVRRTWSTGKAQAIDPAKLRETLADAPEFLIEIVNMPKLKDAYPTVYKQLGKVKPSKRTITVRLVEEATAP